VEYKGGEKWNEGSDDRGGKQQIVLTQYPHVAEIEIEKVRKKETFTAIRCSGIGLSIIIVV
jgi:hypothetical protein